MRVVDFDDGRARRRGGPKLRTGEYVVGFYPGSTTYAVTASGCQATGASRVLRIDADGRTAPVGSLGISGVLFTAGSRA